MVVVGPPGDVVGDSVEGPEETAALLDPAEREADELTEDGCDFAGRSGSLSFFFPNSVEKTTPSSSIVSKNPRTVLIAKA